jgi:hypothetical protein
MKKKRPPSIDPMEALIMAALEKAVIKFIQDDNWQRS